VHGAVLEVSFHFSECVLYLSIFLLVFMVGTPPAKGPCFLRLSVRLPAQVFFVLADTLYAGEYMVLHLCVRCRLAPASSDSGALRIPTRYSLVPRHSVSFLQPCPVAL